MKKKESPFEPYFAEYPEKIRTVLETIAQTIRAAVPDAEEKISYKMPSFHCNGPLVYFAAFKHHIGFYPTATGIARFQKEIQGYASSKGAVQFPLDKPIPYDLIKAITLYKFEENRTKKGKKS